MKKFFVIVCLLTVAFIFGCTEKAPENLVSDCDLSQTDSDAYDDKISGTLVWDKQMRRSVANRTAFINNSCPTINVLTYDHEWIYYFVDGDFGAKEFYKISTSPGEMPVPIAPETLRAENAAVEALYSVCENAGNPIIIGDKIYYTVYSYADSGSGLYCVNIDGSNNRLIAPGNYWHGYSNFVYISGESEYDKKFYLTNLAYFYEHHVGFSTEHTYGHDIMCVYKSGAFWIYPDDDINSWDIDVEPGTKEWEKYWQDAWYMERLYTDQGFHTIDGDYFYEMKCGEAFCSPFEIYRLKIDGSSDKKELVTEMDDGYFMISDGILYCNKNGGLSSFDLKTKKTTKISDETVFCINIAGDWLFCSSNSYEDWCDFRIRLDGSDKQILPNTLYSKE